MFFHDISNLVFFWLFNTGQKNVTDSKVKGFSNQLCIMILPFKCESNDFGNLSLDRVKKIACLDDAEL